MDEATFELKLTDYILANREKTFWGLFKKVNVEKKVERLF